MITNILIVCDFPHPSLIITFDDTSRISWTRYNASKTSLSAYDEAVNAADIAALGTRKIYQSSLVSAIDLIDTEQVLLNARIDQENARHEYILSAYRILSIIGEINVMK